MPTRTQHKRSAQQRLRRFVFIALASALASYLATRHRREKEAALARLRAGSRIMHTPLGAIEYAVAGQGPALLVMHGAGGGYDQGLLLTRIIDPQRYTVIAISRPGYRQTPLSSGATTAAQADVCAALLDALDIPSVAVLGISAGGMPAYQFALRHAQRCWALMQISSVAPATLTVQAEQWKATLLQAMMASDFLMWLALKVGVKALYAMEGFLDQLPADERGASIIHDLIGGMSPASDWRRGALNDIAQVYADVPCPLEQISTPTLLIHGTRDSAVPYEVARISAATIDGAELVTIEGGTHFIVGTHRDILAQRLEAFLATHMPQR